jgi:hypothetical protein
VSADGTFLMRFGGIVHSSFADNRQRIITSRHAGHSAHRRHCTMLTVSN